jgi:anti-sigma factor RsiW
MCKDLNIKELLPAYAEQTLAPTEAKRVEEHLAACEDCRSETALLRIMLADVVPDPGETFWTTMPDRVYRAVQEQKSNTGRFALSWLADRLTMPRWAWVAASVGVVLIISLFTLRAVQRESNMPVSAGDDSSDEIMVVNSPISVAELSQDQIDAIDMWAGSELASIEQEAAPVVVGSVHTSDIYEELADLNAKEIDSLSKMIEQWKEEG